MKITTLAFVLMLAAASTGQAALEPLEEAVEASLADVTLPAHEASRVVIRECSGCEAQTYRVNSDTRYQLGNSTVSLEELSATAKAQDSEVPVYVFYSVDNGFVTRIVLDLVP